MGAETLSFELGPIRPPNEARSLLLRFTRNCPWNQCLFCPAYKKRKFSLRTLDERKKDIHFLNNQTASGQQPLACCQFPSQEDYYFGAAHLPLQLDHMEMAQRIEHALKELK